MRTLVTGADGLLGSHIVRALLDAGQEVRALVQPGTTAPTLEGLNIERVDGDLLDPNSLATAVQGCERVVHAAAITDMGASREKTFEVNVEGTRHLVDASLAADVKRLIFVSSASAHAPGTLEAPGDEASPFPDAHRGLAYAESKHAAAELVRSAVRDRGLDAVIVAPTFMLGDHDWRPSSGEMLRQYLERGIPAVPPGGRNFANAADVAAGVVAAAERGERGETYLLGGENLPYAAFFDAVARAACAPAPRWVLPKSVMLGFGAVGSLVGALNPAHPPQLDLRLARVATLDAYYSSAKAEREVGYVRTPIALGVASELGALRRFGHLRDPHAEDLKGQVALVTGASRGVGLATARELSRRGAKVVMTARGADRLNASADLLSRLGGDVRAVVGDVALWEDAERMVQTAIDAFGRLDIVVNNAGVSMRGEFGDLSPEVCKDTIGTNLLGSVYVTRAATAHLAESRGHVVFISSIAGLLGLPSASTYCASKTALTGLAESLRLELGPRGVHVGVVHLGFTEHDPEKRILAADGELVLPDRPAHVTQADAARAIVRLVMRRSRRTVMTPVGKLAWFAHQLSPVAVEWAITQARSGRWGTYERFS